MMSNWIELVKLLNQDQAGESQKIQHIQACIVSKSDQPVSAAKSGDLRVPPTIWTALSAVKEGFKKDLAKNSYEGMVRDGEAEYARRVNKEVSRADESSSVGGN